MWNLTIRYSVHSYVLSEYALGLDNVGHFYDTLLSEEEEVLLNDISKHDIFLKTSSRISKSE